MDHGMTVRPPVAKKKRGHYSPYAFLSLNNTTGAKITLFRRRYGIAPHVRYAVASRTNTDSLVKGMILFDQGGGGAPLFLFYRHRQTNRHSVVRLFFLIFFALRILSIPPE